MPLISVSHVSPFGSSSYLLYALIDQWRELGIDVEVGPGFRPDADLGILHHNRTRMETSDIPSAPEGLRILNSDVLDISKRLYSELMIDASSDWTGPVIVKTNLNSFGNPERYGAKRNIGYEVQKLIARYNWKLARNLPKGVYPVLDSIDDVPDWVWGRNDLLVERFMPEIEGDLFATRGWVFLGAASYGFRILSSEPIVKVRSIIAHDYLVDVPPELEEARQRLGFDYGKFDYVVHEGRATLFDANKTPTLGGDPKSERVVALAKGVLEYLP